MQHTRGTRPRADQSDRERVTLQSLMRGDYLTLSKARVLLGGAEWRTLHGWIEELGIQTYAHPTDRRAVLLRSADVEKIARISDRPFHLPEKQRTRKSSRAVLERQLAELREQFERTVQDYEGRLRELQEQHQLEVKRLRQRISELETPTSQ